MLLPTRVFYGIAACCVFASLPHKYLTCTFYSYPAVHAALFVGQDFTCVLQKSS